ncbi:MAG: mandelate racemase/muconate lactonizing enzyme family protein [Geminicoccaceae bacterium]
MAKIVDVSATAHSRPFDKSGLVRNALGANIKRDFVLVRVTADDGTVGFGESHHGQNPTAMVEVVKGMGSLAIGADPFDSEGIWARLAFQQVQTHGLGAGSVIALSGIDMALWDLKGKLLGQPVYKLLGGAKKRLRAYAGGLALGFQPVDTLEKEVAALMAQGYTAIKLRVGDHPRRDAMRVAHIRKTFGDDLDIAVDAQTRYTPLDIPEVLDYCDKYRVYWLEEPFATDNIRAYVETQAKTRIPLAAGENHYTRKAFRELFNHGAIAIAQADCTKAGGISEVKKIADMSVAYDLWMAPHTSHSIISAAANTHLLCALSNGLIYEADVAKVNPFRTDLSKVPFGVVDGHIEPNDLPGLGLDIDEAVLAAHPAIPGPCYIPGA